MVTHPQSWVDGTTRSAIAGFVARVRHDHAEREFDDDAGAERVLDTARGSWWTIVSMKDDWSDVFGDPAGRA